MEKNYTVLNLIENWEEDLNKEEKQNSSPDNKPSKDIISNILFYALDSIIYSPTLKGKINLCLN